MRAAILAAPLLLLAACSGGSSEPLDNQAADAGSGVAEVYGNDGSVLPDGGADAGSGSVSSSINETEPAAAAPTPVAGGPELTQEQIQEQYSPAYDTCLNSGDAAKGVTPAMAQCIADETAVQDERLNAAYRSAMDKRDEAGKLALRDEERAWIKARDTKCNALAQGGSIDRIEIPSCVLSETVRRRVKLQPMAG